MSWIWYTVFCICSSSLISFFMLDRKIFQWIISEQEIQRLHLQLYTQALLSPPSIPFDRENWSVDLKKAYDPRGSSLDDLNEPIHSGYLRCLKLYAIDTHGRSSGIRRWINIFVGQVLRRATIQKAFRCDRFGYVETRGSAAAGYVIRPIRPSFYSPPKYGILDWLLVFCQSIDYNGAAKKNQMLTYQ